MCYLVPTYNELIACHFFVGTKTYTLFSLQSKHEKVLLKSNSVSFFGNQKNELQKCRYYPPYSKKSSFKILTLHNEGVGWASKKGDLRDMIRTKKT